MRTFWRNRKGNVAVLFALAAVPVMGALGAALDYSMANAYRSDMQKALDATALAISKHMPMNEADLNKLAMQYFAASMGNHNMTNVSLEVVPGQGTASLHVKGDYTPIMASLFGATQFEIGATTVVQWGIGKVEVALVLDNSGSMGSLSRMTHLKAAAHDLLNVLESSAKNPGDAKVAIVPFDSAVRVNYTQANAPAWVKWGNAGSCSLLPSLIKSQSNCASWGGVWTWNSWTATKWGTWDGCLEDRDYSTSPAVENDVLDTAPDTTTGMSTTALRTRYPAKGCDDNKLRRVTPLTENWATMRSEIDAMEPAGFTNIAIGMAWGWHVLSPTEIYTEGAAYGTKDLTKFVILMTDGDNTRSRHSNSETAMNLRTSAVCTNIKNASIQIYSIRLIEGNADLIKNCASKPSMYYDVQNANALSSVFKDIAAQIASLHLAK